MPRWIPVALLFLGCLALVPVACVARSRSVRSAAPRFHLVPDMDNQGRFKAQQANPLFADGRAMRPPVAGTVPQNGRRTDEHFLRGKTGDAHAGTLPVPLTMDLLRRGRQRYEIVCAPCHGLAGYGDGMIARRADALQQGTWVPPSTFHAEPTLSRSPGHLYNTITNGIRNMPAYGSQVAVDDRWAIVAYVRALQRSQRSPVADVPIELRSSLR